VAHAAGDPVSFRAQHGAVRRRLAAAVSGPRETQSEAEPPVPVVQAPSKSTRAQAPRPPPVPPRDPSPRSLPRRSASESVPCRWPPSRAKRQTPCSSPRMSGCGTVWRPQESDRAPMHPFRPRQDRRRGEKREKLGCKPCRKDVSVARTPKCRAWCVKWMARFLAKLADEKCSLALPVDRNAAKLARLGPTRHCSPTRRTRPTRLSPWRYASSLPLVLRRHRRPPRASRENRLRLYPELKGERDHRVVLGYRRLHSGRWLRGLQARSR
jgi:hypothetical protein